MRQTVSQTSAMPKDLRRHILSFLNFFELASLQKKISTKAEGTLPLLSNDINFILNKKGLADLKDLLSSINLEVDSQKPYRKLLEIHQNDLKNSMLKIKEKREKFSRLDSDKIIKIFSHISLLNLEKEYADLFFKDFYMGYYEMRSGYIPLFHNLMTIGVDMTNSRIWQICVDFGTEQDCLQYLEASNNPPQDRPFELSYYDEGGAWNPEIEFTIAKHNPLTQALFAQSPQQVIDTVLLRFPQLALETITFFDKAIDQCGYDNKRMPINFDPLQLQKAWKKFLQTKIPENIQVKELTKNTKESAVKIILEEITNVNNLQEVLTLYERYKNSIILNSRQHSKWDNFCGLFQGRPCDPNYTNSKKEILLALQSKAYELATVTDNPNDLLSHALSSDLFSTQHHEYGLSNKIYLQLSSALSGEADRNQGATLKK